MSTLDDSTARLQGLLDAASGGDESAYVDLIGRSRERLELLTRAMLRRYPRLKRWEETDDVLQRAMLKLHRSLTATRPTTTLHYLKLANTQIHRTLLDLTRHYYGVHGLGANHKTDGGNGDSQVADQLAWSSPSEGLPGDLLEWAAFHEAIESLPGDERDAFELVWYSGQTVRGSAEVLGVSVRTVVRRLNRARTLLYESMKGERPGGDA
ncbi:MAG: sigma-70 family RNA polymerase sigma factor [Planctomycetota bacterium]